MPGTPAPRFQLPAGLAPAGLAAATVLMALGSAQARSMARVAWRASYAMSWVAAWEPAGVAGSVQARVAGATPAWARTRTSRGPWGALRAFPSHRLGLEPDQPEADATSDSQLVAAAKYGDPDAFDLLVARFTPVLHAVARRLVGDDLASDVVQDSLLAAFRNLGRYRGEATFGSYLHGIVVHRCRRVGRRWHRQTASSEVLATLASPGAGPAELSERSDTLRHVEAALRQLPVPFRETLALREFGGLGYDEIAGVLGVPVGTVRSRLARARSLLRDELARVGIRP